MYPFTCTCYPDNLTNDPLKGFRSSRSRQNLSNGSQYNVCGTPLVYDNSFNLPFFTVDGNDHGVIIVRVEANYIFLKQGDRGLWWLVFAFSIDFWEIFYTQDLAGIPSTRKTSFPAPDESSCYGV